MESGRNEASLVQRALDRSRRLTERDEELQRLARSARPGSNSSSTAVAASSASPERVSSTPSGRAVELRNLVNEAELACLVCSLSQLELVASVLPYCPTVKSVVVMDVKEQDRSAVDTLALARQTSVP
jgi:hypothetical protein